VGDGYAMLMKRDVVHRRTVQRSCSVMDVDTAASVTMRSTILGISLVSNSEQETSLRSHTTASLVRKHVLKFDFFAIYVEKFNSLFHHIHLIFLPLLIIWIDENNAIRYNVTVKN